MYELRYLVNQVGKDKINSLTKYPSIPTLHELGHKGVPTNNLNVLFDDSEYTYLTNGHIYATEKIDGTNVRIICLYNEYLIGSRENILYYSNDLYFDNSQTIVQSIKSLNLQIPFCNVLTVFYGELYGGKVSSNSKNYGTEQVGFRLFDVVSFDNFDVENFCKSKTLEEISHWREHKENDKIVYGQSFYNVSEFKEFTKENYFLSVPVVNITLNDLSLEGVLNSLKLSINETKVALTDTATRIPEGVVIRNYDRSKIAKIRFEDYNKIIQS